MVLAERRCSQVCLARCSLSMQRGMSSKAAQAMGQLVPQVLAPGQVRTVQEARARKLQAKW